MEVLREAALPSSVPIGLIGFNPCFNGSVERGARRLCPAHYNKAQVSILVLMEVLREGRPYCRGDAVEQGFQSLF